MAMILRMIFARPQRRTLSKLGGEVRGILQGRIFEVK